ncbi:hypothetical protein [Pseudogemmobacter sonorensis]|uniref:hypothetical protein n=1 Tax=Pseudogemmobacter sonorensis TaxID=2989681 RepID=UPI003686B4AD
MSIKNIGFAALITIASVGSAIAAGAGSDGKDQLARILGVDADQFTTAQLLQLQDARRENDAERFNFILSQAGGATASAGASTSAGNVQRALALGVEPGRFTAAELSQLEVARRNGDTEVVKFILSGDNRKPAAEAGVVTAGKAQLAASLGVNPADYTLAELTRLDADRQGADN